MGKKKLKFSIIGCGNISRKHVSCILDNEKSELVAVCDLNEKASNELGKKLNTPSFKNINEMVKSINNDVFVALTPSGNHYEVVKELIRYKKDIIVEKPLSLSLNQGKEMIMLCKKNNIVLSVVKQNRFNLPIIFSKKIIDEGKIGNIFLGTIRVRWTRTQEYYDSADWRGTWKNDGGVISNQAIHHIDMLQWLMGEVKSVNSACINALIDIEAEDTSVSILKFKNGGLGIIEATNATRPKDLEGSISILGTKGSIEVGGFSMDKMISVQSEDLNATKDLEIFKENPKEFAFSHKSFYKDFVNSRLRGLNPSVLAEEALKSLKIVHAIYKSNEENREVFLDDLDLQSKLGTSE